MSAIMAIGVNRGEVYWLEQ